MSERQTQNQTVSRTESMSGPRATHRDEPAIFVLVVAGTPALGSSRHLLGEVDEVIFERGRERASRRPRAERQREEPGRRLQLSLPDRWMSTQHARLYRQRAHFVLEDCGSKNGVLVNGERKDKAILLDGDLFEIGRTTCLFREAIRVADDAPDFDSTQTDPALGLATLLPSLGRVFADALRMAESRATILIQGESGVGKELLAAAIHRQSGRPGKLVAVNCGGLPETLIESELFGYQKGAFSGANEAREGLIAASDRGTLFLDEIGDLPSSSQATLLRVLEDSAVRPVGATEPTRVDLRVVAATHRDLEADVRSGRFREDLLARIAGHVATLPPLRARREDLGLLLGALTGAAAPEPVMLSGSATRALLAYAWPRNVRELKKCMERAVVLAAGASIEPAHLPETVSAAGATAAPTSTLADTDRARRDALEQLLRAHKGNVSAVARQMDRARSQIQRWLKRYGLDPRKYLEPE